MVTQESSAPSWISCFFFLSQKGTGDTQEGTCCPVIFYRLYLFFLFPFSLSCYLCSLCSSCPAVLPGIAFPPSRLIFFSHTYLPAVVYSVLYMFTGGVLTWLPCLWERRAARHGQRSSRCRGAGAMRKSSQVASPRSRKGPKGEFWVVRINTPRGTKSLLYR